MRLTFPLILLLASVSLSPLAPQAAHATGDPSTATLIGWSADGNYVATFHEGETSKSGLEAPAVEVKEAKNGQLVLVLRVQEYCAPKLPFQCEAVGTPDGADITKRLRRLGPRHPLLKKYKLLPVRKEWRTRYKGLGLRLKRGAKRAFKDGRTDTSWEILRSDGTPIGSVVRGESDMPGHTRVVGGYMQEPGLVLLKLKEFGEGHRHQQFYLVVDTTAERRSVLH